MNRSLLVGVISSCLLIPVAARGQVAPGPYFARGSFFCSTSLQGTTPPDSCYGYGDPVRLYDDGQHGDGSAGDGVYAADVVCNQPAGMREFKLANADWSLALPTAPGYELEYGRVFTSGPGDIVHFRLDTAAPPLGWLPEVSVSNDHAAPPGAQLELMGSAPELGGWANGLPADHAGTIWSKLVTIATPGTYEFKFRVLGTWGLANFGADYNNTFGRNGVFTTVDPNTELTIQFDELTGRIRAVRSAQVSVRETSWGGLKRQFR